MFSQNSSLDLFIACFFRFPLAGILELWGPDLRAGFWWADGFSRKFLVRICYCCQSDWCMEEKYVLLLDLMLYSFIVALKCLNLQDITYLWCSPKSVSASLFQFLIYRSGLVCLLRFHISVIKNVLKEPLAKWISLFLAETNWLQKSKLIVNW